MYKAQRPNMNFGDLIAFSGNSLASKIIKWKTKSDISHVGLVMDVKGRIDNRHIVLIESTSLVNLPDYRTGLTNKGVQLQLLSDRVKTYDGKIYHYPLKRKMNQTQRKDCEIWFNHIWERNIPYDLKQAVGSSLDKFIFRWLGNEDDTNALFCSELVANAYLQARKFKGNPSEQTPKDIIDLPLYEDRVQIK